MPGLYTCYECEHDFFSDEEPCVDVGGHLYCTCCAPEEDSVPETEEVQDEQVLH